MVLIYMYKDMNCNNKGNKPTRINGVKRHNQSDSQRKLITIIVCTLGSQTSNNRLERKRQYNKENPLGMATTSFK